MGKWLGEHSSQQVPAKRALTPVCRGHAPPPVSMFLTPRPASSAQAWLPSPGSEPGSATDEPTAASGWAKGLFLASFLGAWETVGPEPLVTWPSCGDQTRSTRAVPCPFYHVPLPGVTRQSQDNTAFCMSLRSPRAVTAWRKSGQVGRRRATLGLEGLARGPNSPSVSVHGHSPVASVGAQPAALTMSLRVGMQPSSAQGAALLMLSPHTVPMGPWRRPQGLSPAPHPPQPVVVLSGVP